MTCKGCNRRLEPEDIEFAKRDDVEEGLCQMCWALGTPDEFLQEILTPSELGIYNRLMNKTINPIKRR